MIKELFGAQGRNHRPDEAADDRRVLRRRLLEIISILFRPISLSFRLYGNVFAGENMLETMATIVPGLGLAAADTVLLHGAAGRPGAGDGLHAADRRLHAAHLPARRSRAAARTAERSRQT